ncbi:MAG: hypothetical protein ACREI7_06795, partial [Myxococcota bacterium]
DANVSVSAQTHADGHDIRVGQAFASDPRQSLMGAIGGNGGITADGHGGGGDASGTSSGVALGDSSVEVYDLAIGGSPLQGGAFDRIHGGDASSLATATTAGSSRAVAHSLAIAGSGLGGAGEATSDAHAEGRGEVDASAVARVAPGTFSLTDVPNTIAQANARGVGSSGSASAAASSGGTSFGTIVGAQAFASATVLGDAAVAVRAGGDGLLTSAALRSAPADATTLVTRGSTQTTFWGSAAVALDDTQVHDGTDILLRSEAAFSGSTSASALAAGLYVSFLSVELDQEEFDELALRISNGSMSVFERIFDDAAAAIEFFGQNLFLSDLTSVSPTFPGRFDLQIALELTSDRTGGRFATTFALGSTPIPEPTTGTLTVLGLIVLVTRRRIATRRSA